MTENKVNGNKVDEDLDYQRIIPAMNVTPPAAPSNKENDLITDEAMLGIYVEILNKIKNDQSEVDHYISLLAEMVFNAGDATTASKEALVNLVKERNVGVDRMTKVADLMTRIKLKERDTFPRYLAAHQNNTINIGDSGAKQTLLQAIKKAQKKKKEEHES